MPLFFTALKLFMKTKMKIQFTLITMLIAIALMLTTASFQAEAQGRISFLTIRDGNIEVYVMNADGSGQTRLTSGPGNSLFPSFSPDGSKIAFTSDRDGDKEIYVMNADGSGQIRLTNSVGDDTYPTFSPDGKIAFTSNRNG